MQSGVHWDNKSEGEKNTWNRYRRANSFLARKLENEKPYEGEYHALMTFEDFKKKMLVTARTSLRVQGFRQSCGYLGLREDYW